MFWKFNLIQTSRIEALLGQENVTLQELMDEEDVLQECKVQNKALTDFLIRPEIMAQMINLVISEPVDDADDSIKYKYSNIASELLTSDVPQINDALANDKALLSKLYSFLENEKPLNPLLASFFSKTMGILISRKMETTFEFLKSKDFVNSIVNHLRTSAIMDLLLRLVTCPETAQLRLDILNWLNQQQAIQRLVALINPNSEEERHCNASQAVCDIIRMAREQHSQLQEKLEFDPLLQSIESYEVISELLNHMFSGEKNESALVNGIMVLLTLLETKKPCLQQQHQQQQQQQIEQSSMYFHQENQDVMSPQDEERQKQSITRTALAILPRLKDFHQLLIEPPKKNPISTSVCILDPPLGSTRIHVTRLISALVSANIHAVNVELANLGSLDVILDLFFQYSWNNFVHTQVEQCIGTILTNPPTEDETGQQSQPLIECLFVKCNLIRRILGAWEDNDKAEAKPGGHRRGYMGHLTHIVNHVLENLDNGANSALIIEKLKELSVELREKWDAFIVGPLADINKKNVVLPVGLSNNQLSSEDDTESNSFPPDTPMQQAFSDYQMQQMTSTFIDQFGVDDGEYGDYEENVNGPLERLTNVSFSVSAEEDARRDLFERACNERIQPLDDADSDEDIFDDKEITFANAIDRRPRGGAPVAMRMARVGSNQSTDSEDGDDDVKPVPVSSSTPAPIIEEMKMEVDQGDAWPANIDAVPMDTGNPWESSSPFTVSPILTTSQETGWADFGNFTDFGAANLPRSDNARRLTISAQPVAMETSEESTFKSDETVKLATKKESETSIIESSSEKDAGSTIVASSLSVVSQSPVTPPPMSSLSSSSTPPPPPEHDTSSSSPILHAGNGDVDATSRESVLTSVGAPPTSPSLQPSLETTKDNNEHVALSWHEQNSESKILENNVGDSDVEKSNVVNCSADDDDMVNRPSENDEQCEGDDLSQNFNYLLSAGLIKSEGEASTAVSRDGISLKENGPSNTIDELSKQAKVEEARAKALEAFEQLAAVGVTPNGPV